ncbi:hypothetical protein ACMBCN_01125, partial [Candidatus Liberibacter asiaticus]|nr:hypothetical protein [Candidatus Liberibacter asiaticus]
MFIYAYYICFRSHPKLFVYICHKILYMLIYIYIYIYIYILHDRHYELGFNMYVYIYITLWIR